MLDLLEVHVHCVSGRFLIWRISGLSSAPLVGCLLSGHSMNRSFAKELTAESSSINRALQGLDVRAVHSGL